MTANWENCKWIILEIGRSGQGSQQAQELPVGESGGFLGAGKPPLQKVPLNLGLGRSRGWPQ